MSQLKKLTLDEVNIWKNAINLALEHFCFIDWEAKNNSTKYDVLYKGKRIPPKQIIAFVFKYFSENNIATSIRSVKGGDKGTNDLLKDFGLEIVEKKKGLKEFLAKIDVWPTWSENYSNFVPKFIKEASVANSIVEWDKDLFIEFFEKSNLQCVSSLKQGYFSSIEKTKIKQNWDEISPLLASIAKTQDFPPFDTYTELKGTLRKYTQFDRRAATNRL
ncbi:MAG: hypothetical protein EOP00_21195, partial [Pedobacter sp.]